MKLSRLFVKKDENLDKNIERLLSGSRVAKKKFGSKVDAWTLLRGKLRHAGVEDYKKWFKGYKDRRGVPMPVYDRPIKKSDLRDLYVAVDDFEIVPLFGSRAIRIIVPADVRFLGGDLGETVLYFEDGYWHNGFAPSYSDI